MSMLTNIVGTAGVLFILTAYFLLQTGKLQSTRLLFSVMNGFGSLLILFSLVFDFNFPSVVIEFFWLLISVYGIIKYFRNRNKNIPK